jgi:transketolase
MSAADLLAALYFDWLRIDPSQPDWTDRDRFVLSKGHGNAALSAVLALAGFFPLEDLDRFYGMASPLGMHPDIKVPGMEMSTGGLGTDSRLAWAWHLVQRDRQGHFVRW